MDGSRAGSDLEHVARALGGAQRTTNGFDSRCPCHDDRSASLSLSMGADGRLLWHCHAGCSWEIVRDELRRRGLLQEAEGGGGRRSTGAPPAGRRIVATYDYLDEAGELVFQVVRLDPKDFRQRRRARPDDDPAKVRDGWTWSVKGLRVLPYRLPEILEAITDRIVVVVEGEKDADNLARLGLAATCNAGGAGKWRKQHAAALAGADVVILPDNDDAGRDHARQVAASLVGIAKCVRVLELPGLPPKGDVSDWLSAGGTADELWRLIEGAPDGQAAPAQAAGDVSVEDFIAYLPANKFLYRPTSELWPAESVDASVEAPGRGRRQKASKWLAENRAVHQMTWAPGEVEIIGGKHLVEGGWVDKPGARTYNTYKPPKQLVGDATKAGPWLEHLRYCYPADAEHLIDWLAHRVQRPAEKINHAIVLGGAPGLGKDSILVPVREAVGAWNLVEVSPAALMGRFSPFAKAVILRINEAHDLGDINRYQFYDRTKTYIAAPPDTLVCELKGRNPFSVPNVMGVIITTNHKTDGLHLPPDDRRHYVAWSDALGEDFAKDYFDKLYAWFYAGGIGHVAAFLRARDISAFNAKRPPPKTDAWHEIVTAGTSPERNDIGDIIRALGDPDAVTVQDIVVEARTSNPSLETWLGERSSRRLIPIRMEEAGYVAARNPNEKAGGRWLVSNKLVVVYAKKTLTAAQRLEAARTRVANGRARTYALVS